MKTCTLCQNPGPVALSIQEAEKKIGAVLQLEGLHKFYVHLACAQALAELANPPRIDVGPF